MYICIKAKVDVRIDCNDSRHRLGFLGGGTGEPSTLPLPLTEGKRDLPLDQKLPTI